MAYKPPLAILMVTFTLGKTYAIVSRYLAVPGKALQGYTSQTKQNSNNHDNKHSKIRRDTRIDLLV